MFRSLFAMNDADPVLIVLLPHPRDLALAQGGSYRIPMRHAPAALASARALAFYQPASFGEAARWQVAWWAEVRAVGMQRRRDLLPDEATHPRADEWYAVVALGPLQPFEPPLQASRGRRFLYIPTRWGTLRHCGSLDELLRHAPRPVADDLLYGLIQQQVEGQAAIRPDGLAQGRLFEEEGGGDGVMR